MTPCLPLLIGTGMVLSNGDMTAASEKVTVDNFVRAESDMIFSRYVKEGAFGQILNMREPTPIDRQDVIRMNRDTIYAMGVFDLSEPVTIVKPDTGWRFQSMQVVNQDQYTLAVEYEPGEYTYSRDRVGTRYIILIFRTFIDAGDPADVKAASALQDMIEVRQKSPGNFTIPDWDEATLKKLRDAINVLAATKTSTKGMFGDKSQVVPIDHLLGTAFGWGGNPESAAVYDNVVPEKNDGQTPYILSIPKEVPVEGFWSITIYNAEGFMQKNSLNAYAVNNVTAKKNPDDTVTVHFGGDPSKSNYLPITPGWNYIVRMYRPKQAVIDGAWTFPRPKPLK
jgi:hypothetical protein